MPPHLGQELLMVSPLPDLDHRGVADHMGVGEEPSPISAWGS